MPDPVTVVLPLQSDPNAVLSTVEALVAGWPDDVEGRLVVPARPLSARDRRLLQAVEGDVDVVESADDAATFGELAVLGGAQCGGDVLVVREGALPLADELAALLTSRPAHPVTGAGLLLVPGGVLGTAVLSAATDLSALTALACALFPAPEPDIDPGPVLEPAFAWDAPARPGMVSVVIPVWNQLDHTRRCVESVRRTTRRPYEIVVVDNGSVDGTDRWLAQQRDLRVVSNATDRGFAKACNQGIAAARGEHVVLLNNDTIVPRFWVEGLLRAFATDPAVGAVGPRSNAVPGSQLVPDADYGTLEEYRRFADDWRRRHAGRHTEQPRLVGFCLAVRRDALEQVGGLDEGYGQGDFEDDDLCLRLTRAGWRLLVAHEVLVHRGGSATLSASGACSAAFLRGLAHHEAKWTAPQSRPGGRPLLSAALIVKDEQRALPACLASLRGVVDEVVVCDTGSTDRTVEIAEALGARVVSTPWRDDFAAARNTALEAARGEWVLSIDADETLVREPGVDLKVQLLLTHEDGAAVQIRSGKDEGGISHHATRLLRRDQLHWRGVIHESPVRRDGGRLVVVGLQGLHLQHDGYTQEVYDAKDKGRRNAALAERNYRRDCEEDGGQYRWKGAFELARALTQYPEHRARVEELLREALRLLPETQTLFRAETLLRLADLLLQRDELDEAERLLRASLALRPGSPLAVYRLAGCLHRRGQGAQALALLDEHRADGVPDDPGLRDVVCEKVQLPNAHGRLLLAHGRADEALELLSGAALHAPDQGDWGALAAAAREASDPWANALARRFAPVTRHLLAGLQHLPPSDVEALHDALRAVGVDPAEHEPEAVWRAHVLDAVRGCAAPAVAAAAAQLEATDVRAALLLWETLPSSSTVQVARARCQVALGELAAAADALQGLQLDELDGAERVTVAAVAAAVGDVATAADVLDVLDGLPAVGSEVAEQADALRALLAAV